MRFFYFIILFSLILTFSCKKKSAEPESAPVTHSPDYSDAYSMLQTTKSISNIHGVVTKDSSGMAVFFEKPLKYSTNLIFISAGNVTLNDSVLYYDSQTYSSYLPANFTSPVKWAVAGSGTVTPFTYTQMPNYPVYNGGNLLPDTCIKSNGITINVSGVSNTSMGVSLFLNGSSVSLNKYIANSGNGTVVFSASEIAGMNINSNVTLQLMMSNYNIQTLNGVVHNFVSTTSYQIQIWLK